MIERVGGNLISLDKRKIAASHVSGRSEDDRRDATIMGGKKAI